MPETPVGTRAFIEIQGHYGISPYTHERQWRMWGETRDVADARSTIRNLGLSEAPEWRHCNGWGILEVVETAVVHEGVKPAAMKAARGRHVEMRYEIQGLYRNLNGKSSSWKKWRDAETLRSGLADMKRMQTTIAGDKRHSRGPSEMRLLVVSRDVAIIERPDAATLVQHEIPGAPDPARTALVFHQKDQPCGYQVTWAEEGYHAADRPQIGPLPVGAHTMRREGRLSRLF